MDGIEDWEIDDGSDACEMEGGWVQRDLEIRRPFRHGN